LLFRALAPGGAVGGPIYLASLDSPDRTAILEADSTNVQYSAGHLLFMRDATLMAQPFDAARRVPVGEPFPIVESIQTLGNVPSGAFSASENGVLAYQTGAVALGTQLVWFDRTGKQLGFVGERLRYSDIRLAPDGRRVAVSRREGGPGTAGNVDIWILDVLSGLPTRFTFDPAIEFTAAWSPDSRVVAFNSARKGQLDLYQKSADGSGAEEELLVDDSNKFPAEWSPDGRFLLYTANLSGRGVGARRGRAGAVPTPDARGPAATAPPRLWILPMTGDRKPFPLTPGGSAESPGAFSPDGRWVAYASNETGRFEVYVVAFPPGSGGKWQISKAGGNLPRWGRDGKEIFYVSPQPRLMLTVARVDGQGSALRVLEIQPLFPINPVGARSTYAVSPDGQRFLVNTPGANPNSAPEPATIVVDWLASHSNGR
jgi:dipeptidyl aminopeptidase/acylaminoacyl peptidase